jgi:hypothetical protein
MGQTYQEKLTKMEREMEHAKMEQFRNPVAERGRTEFQELLRIQL